MGENGAAERSGGVSLSNVERVITVILAIAGPLYPFGLLVVQRQLSASDYRLDADTAWHAVFLMPQARIIAEGIQALKAPPALLFALGMGLPVANAAWMAERLKPFISSGLAEETPLDKQMGARMRLWLRIYPYCQAFQTVIGLSVLLLNIPPLPTLVSGGLVVVSAVFAYQGLRAYSAQRPLRRRALLSTWMLWACICAYLASLIFTYYWPSTSKAHLATVTITMDSGLLIDGGLLTFADGHWYVAIKPTTEATGRLIAIPGDKATSVVIAPATPQPSQAP